MDTPPRHPTKPRNDLPPMEVERWEGEGGHPPVAPHEKHIPEVTNILKKFLLSLRSHKH